MHLSFMLMHILNNSWCDWECTGVLQCLSSKIYTENLVIFRETILLYWWAYFVFFLKRWWDGSGISWTTHKSIAPQIITPPHITGYFYRPDPLPDDQPGGVRAFSLTIVHYNLVENMPLAEVVWWIFLVPSGNVTAAMSVAVVSLPHHHHHLCFNHHFPGEPGLSSFLSFLSPLFRRRMAGCLSVPQLTASKHCR